ncbi:MAG: glycosyltransferase family 39 protein [Candidatus Omnitrophota bacterium]
MNTNSNLKLTQTQRLLIVLIFALYTFFVFFTLAKYPTPFYDETAFNNTAHCIANSKECSSTPFSAHLSAPEKLYLVGYVPLYFWLMAFITKIFGFSIYTIRITSYCIGIITLLIFFFMLRKLLKENNIVIVCLLLFAVDKAFISSSKFGRPDILAVCFSTAAILFYLKSYLENESKINFLFCGILYACAFMTHIPLGFYPLCLTVVHFMIVRRYKKYGFKTLLFLLGPTAAFFFSWLIIFIIPQIIKQPGLVNEIIGLYTYRADMHLHALWTVFKWFSGHLGNELAVFYIYAFLWLAVLVCLKNKFGQKWFFFLITIFMYPYLIRYGNLFYASLMTTVASITFGYLASKESRYRKTIIAFIIIVICCNIVRQGRIIKKTLHYSYEEFSQRISNYLHRDAKVLIYSASLNPYFYLAVKRKDLRLEYDRFSDLYDHTHIAPYFRESVANADYIVTSLLHESLRKIENKIPLSRRVFIENRYSNKEKPKVDELIIVDELIKRGGDVYFLDDIEWVVIKLAAPKDEEH